jgi:hypothetical protein
MRITKYHWLASNCNTCFLLLFAVASGAALRCLALLRLLEDDAAGAAVLRRAAVRSAESRARAVTALSSGTRLPRTGQWFTKGLTAMVVAEVRERGGGGRGDVRLVRGGAVGAPLLLVFGAGAV